MRMELPKNIVQIGHPDRTHKIFVEDYVVSYIKQLNRECNGKAIGLALYGKYMEENDCKYYFLYGASRVTGIEHRGPYLSQTDKEEIEDIGARYFEEYHFLAWCSLCGEPVDGFFVQSGGRGMQVDGYACFYEKNESMLNFMLMSQQQPGTDSAEKQKTEREVSQGREAKQEREVKAREAIAMPPSFNSKNRVARRTEYMKAAVAAVFLVLCVVGITTLNDYEKMEELQVAARQVIAGLTEQKLPDAEETKPIVAVSGAENMQETEASEPVDMAEPEILPQPETTPAPVESLPAPIESQPTPETAAATENIPMAYTIARGDTLISICEEKYGSLDRFSEICELNGIIDADSIQIGQTILLPQ